MSRLLIVEEDSTLCTIFKQLLDTENTFQVDIVQTYKEAQVYLNRYRYEFSVVSRTLPDATEGKIIALLNKYNVAPIVYATEIDEDFIESYESASIVEYILRHRYANVEHVVARLRELQKNKKRLVVIAHKSEIYARYLKQNLLLHNFQVIVTHTAPEAIKKLELHPLADILIVDNELKQLAGLDGFDGIELVKRVKKLNLQNLKIISLASESNAYITSRFLNEGADDYLINQYSRDEFYIRIYQNLNNHD